MQCYESQNAACPCAVLQCWMKTECVEQQAVSTTQDAEHWPKKPNYPIRRLYRPSHGGLCSW